MAKVDLSKVKVVSWDIDGTMYALDDLMSAFKLDLIRRMFSLDWVGAWRDFFRLLKFKRHMDRVRKRAGTFEVGPVPDRELIAETQDEMYGRILPIVGRLPGVLELMRWFESQGLKQVVFSDYRPSSKLEALEVAPFFGSVYAGESIGHLKPSPIPFRHIIAEEGIEPHQLLHIGDRADTDGLAAPDVGFQVALIGPDFEHAAALLSHLQDQLSEA